MIASVVIILLLLFLSIVVQASGFTNFNADLYEDPEAARVWHSKVWSNPGVLSHGASHWCTRLFNLIVNPKRNYHICIRNFIQDGRERGYIDNLPEIWLEYGSRKLTEKMFQWIETHGTAILGKEKVLSVIRRGRALISSLPEYPHIKETYLR